LSDFMTMAIHFELAGFLPRLLLGAILGYSYWWSRSLWIPILFHTLFNGSQVIATYISGEYTPDTEDVDLPSPVLTILSLIAVVMLGIFLERDMDNTPPSGAPLVEEEALEQV
ncbi:MAG: CPBP family intramembrane glutamic endopeptidase, partial [Bacteroidota bacterium]